MKSTSPSQLLKQYKRFVEISHSLASTLELDQLLNKIMEVAVDLVDGEEASILLYDQHTHGLYFEAATNADRSPQIQKMYVPEESIAGWVALHRTPQVVNNVRQDERHFDNVEKEVNFITRSLVAVPMLTKQKLIGVLEVLNKKTGEFGPEDQEILQAVGSQAAIAIENSRLFQQSDLVAEFVHELRTPLASIFTASYLLQREEIDADQRISLAKTVHQETQRLNELATVFLDLASLESGRSKINTAPFPVQPLLEECTQVLQIKAVEKEIEILMELQENLPLLNADRGKIKQVLLNLLNNAVKYNRPNGKVWLRARADEKNIILRIEDTGVGIPADQISQLFTRFFRASNVEKTTPGTGLGLSISHRIVEMHNGNIHVTSALNQGTAFEITLPFDPSKK